MARLRIMLVLAAVLAMMGSAGDALAKKKVRTVSVTTSPNATVPGPSGPNPGVLVSTANLGGKAKGRKIRDVNVTIQTTGSVPLAASNILGKLTSPGGANTFIFAALQSQNAGPLTLDDESKFILSTSPPSNDLLLGPPYIGTAQPGFTGSGRPLAVMDGDRAKGAWTLTLLTIGGGANNVLNSWTLTVRAGLPFKTD
jgi:hypothetical protein